MKRGISSIFIAFMLAAFFTGCEKELGKKPPESKVFKIDLFKNNLQTRIASSASTMPRGYSFVISKNGNWVDTVSFGWAYTGASNGNTVSMHVNQEINVASVTKTITAVAALKLIAKNNLQLTSKIGDYLPAYWNARQAVKDITFEQLMNHGSGLTESNTSWDSLKATVASGLDDPNKTADIYANINYALFRAMVPYLDDKTDATNKESSMVPGNTSGFETWMADEYIKYVQENVFTPIGIGSATCTPSVNTANAYSEGGMGAAIQNLTDWKQFCGGGGYFLSPMEMARFVAFLQHSNTLVDNTQRSSMKSKYLGWDNEDCPMVYDGQAVGKDGALWWDSNNTNNQEAGDAGLQTLIIAFPNGVDLSLAINSIPGSYRNLAQIAQQAYNTAWVDE